MPGARRGASIPRIAGLAFFGIAGLLVATLAGQAWLGQAAAQARGEAMLRGAAELVADAVAARLGPLREGLARLGRDERALPASLPWSDSVALARLERSLSDRLPGGIGVRLLPPGYSSPDEGASPPLGFAALDLLRKAEQTSEVVPWEVHLVGTPAQHLAAAVATRDPKGEVRALLRLAVADGSLRLPAVGTVGHLALQQQIGRDWVGLDPQAAPGGEPTGSAPIPFTSLRVAYWQTPAAFLTGLEDGKWLFLVFLLATGWWMRRLGQRLAKDVCHDQLHAMEFAASITRSGVAPALGLRLAETQETVARWLETERPSGAEAAYRVPPALLELEGPAPDPDPPARPTP